MIGESRCASRGGTPNEKLDHVSLCLQAVSRRRGNIQDGGAVAGFRYLFAGRPQASFGLVTVFPVTQGRGFRERSGAT